MMRIKLNYLNRIWIGYSPTRNIKKETILSIKNSSGERKEVFADEVKIFKTYKTK